MSALGGAAAAAAAETPPTSVSPPATPAATSEPAAAPAATSEPAAAPATTASDADQRLLFSGEGSWLTGDHGGAGGSITWLRNFGTGNVLGLGAEYQTVANSHWSLGNITGSLSFGQGVKTALYADVHLGGGATGGESFRYTDLAGGFYLTPTSWFTLQLEERYLDIDKSYGNLPKLGVSFRIVPGLVGTLSYAQSFGGNLGTKLGTARLDYFGKHLNWLAGVAYGPIAPALVNLIGQQLVPAQILREGFIGVGKTFGRADWQLIGDYQDLEGFKRTTITLNCTLHLDARRPSP
jgi:hypothetical protein